MAELFGVPVPPGATRAVIRPIFGRGGTLPLFDGAIGPEGLTETEVIVAAAKNKAFWEYIDDQVDEGRIERPEDGWSFKLSLLFYAGEVKGEPVLTKDKHDGFYRSKKTRGSGGGDAEDAAARIITAGLQVIGKASESGAQIVGKATDSAAQIAQAASGPLSEFVKMFKELQATEIEFREETMNLIGTLNVELRNKPAAAAESMGPWDLLKAAKGFKKLVN